MHEVLSTPILLSSAAEPLTVQEARDWLRLDDATDDASVTALISAARLWFESATDRQLTVATYQLKLRYFPWEIVVPLPPLVSVVSVQYLDVAGVLQTVATSVYNVVTSRVPAVIQPKFDQVWPTTLVHPEAVTITYTAGAVSELVKVGMKLLLAHWYENREAVNIGNIATELPLSVQAIAWAAGSYRP